MSLGPREQRNGTLYYESLPKLDQSYADTGVPGHFVEPPGNPFAGLDQLAARTVWAVRTRLSARPPVS
jgi:hypothetical protein